ncbi:MAG TPA: type VI immunity family protein [Archangium sp.]|uniref:type VI immunity family protein n=1 Tax=Archangium sp. TaxID=1872627 RepID=UPI002E3268AB|nr:type VI immunity family protein [Archangium sp.]HEX5748019.1 type VI immunity family protein [Archangium sp.]
MEAYLAQVGPDTLRTYMADNGQFRPLTSKQISKDLRNLRNLPAGRDSYRILYNQGEEGEVGTHAIYFEGSSLAEPEPLPDKTHVLRLEFPPPPAGDEWLEPFIGFVSRIANLVPFQSGNAGFAFKHVGVLQSNVRKEINQLLPRYYGFDPSYDSARMKMRGRAFGAHWLTLLRTDLIQKLGGMEALRAALPRAELRPLDQGLLIRAARRPPLGDVNRQCADIGCMPEVARLLRPIRYEAKGFGQPQEVFDALAWLARYDDKASQPWDAP